MFNSSSYPKFINKSLTCGGGIPMTNYTLEWLQIRRQNNPNPSVTKYTILLAQILTLKQTKRI